MNQPCLITHSLQRGAALITALIMLVILTMLGLTSITTTTMEEKMAANSQEVNRAFQAASTGLALVFGDNDAFSTINTRNSDGVTGDPYNKADATIGGYGANSYTANATYNSVYQQATVPPRGSGWDTTYRFYHFDLSSSGSIASGAVAELHGGAYQIGKGGD